MISGYFVSIEREMKKVKTRDRILHTSLQLFNQYGAPSVTTNHIADEMDISPGNLYYHFKKKDEIVFCLYESYEEQIMEVVIALGNRAHNLEDLWFYLHVGFEHMRDFRFLFRDLDNLLARNKKLHARFSRRLEESVGTIRSMCKRLVMDGTMLASDDEVSALAKNIVLTATYWLNFARLLNAGPATKNRESGDPLALGVYQVMMLITPYLNRDSRESFSLLAQRYVA